MRIVKTAKIFQLPQKAGKYAVEISFPYGNFPTKKEILVNSKISALQLYAVFSVYKTIIEENPEILHTFKITEIVEQIFFRMMEPCITVHSNVIRTFLLDNCLDSGILLAIEAIEVYYYTSEIEKVICRVED
jgi:hypothetical protein